VVKSGNIFNIFDFVKQICGKSYWNI